MTRCPNCGDSFDLPVCLSCGERLVTTVGRTFQGRAGVWHLIEDDDRRAICGARIWDTKMGVANCKRCLTIQQRRSGVDTGGKIQ